MLGYHARLALHSFRQNKVLTALMVLAIAVGIGTSMTALTVFRVLSDDPIPSKSARLFHVQLDPRPAAGQIPGEEPMSLLNRFDAEALLRDRRAQRQTMTSGSRITVQPESRAIKPFRIGGRNASADFFAMFQAPFAYGHGWSDNDDQARARVAVIDKALNQRLFGGGNSVGKAVRLNGHGFRIVGVLDDWAPKPRFFDPSGGKFRSDEQVYLPFATALDLKLEHSGSVNCYRVTSDSFGLDSLCGWIHYWVELNDPEQASVFKTYLDNYSVRQRDAGRYERAPNSRLRNVMDWLRYEQVVPGDVRLQLWFGFGLLLVCLLNTIGLLLAKFLRRSGEIGVRRALGASRAAIFHQYLIEAASIGLAGGIFGLVLALLGLWLVRQRPTEYAQLAQLDGAMLLLSLSLAILASVLAGLLPAWRATRIAPAIQLKAQ